MDGDTGESDGGTDDSFNSPAPSPPSHGGGTQPPAGFTVYTPPEEEVASEATAASAEAVAEVLEMLVEAAAEEAAAETHVEAAAEGAEQPGEAAATSSPYEQVDGGVEALEEEPRVVPNSLRPMTVTEGGVEEEMAGQAEHAVAQRLPSPSPSPCGGVWPPLRSAPLRFPPLRPWALSKTTLEHAGCSVEHFVTGLLHSSVLQARPKEERTTTWSRLWAHNLLYPRGHAQR